jgi:hypothetical protein
VSSVIENIDEYSISIISELYALIGKRCTHFLLYHSNYKLQLQELTSLLLLHRNVSPIRKQIQPKSRESAKFDANDCSEVPITEFVLQGRSG